MDYFKILCLDLIAKKENANPIIGWSKEVAHSFEHFSSEGYFKQEIIGGNEDTFDEPGIYVL
jgi:hypothetical protein